MGNNPFTIFLQRIFFALLSLSLAFLIYPAVPRIYGICIVLLDVVLYVACIALERQFKLLSQISQYQFPLLTNIILFIGGGVYIIIGPRELITFFLCVSLSGLFGIIYWIADKRYMDKSVTAVIKDEFHLLSPEIEFGILAMNALLLVFDIEKMSIATIVVNLLILVDAIIQTHEAGI